MFKLIRYEDAFSSSQWTLQSRFRRLRQYQLLWWVRPSRCHLAFVLRLPTLAQFSFRRSRFCRCRLCRTFWRQSWGFLLSSTCFAPLSLLWTRCSWLLRCRRCRPTPWWQWVRLCFWCLWGRLWVLWAWCFHRRCGRESRRPYFKCSISLLDTCVAMYVMAACFIFWWFWNFLRWAMSILLSFSFFELLARDLIHGCLIASCALKRTSGFQMRRDMRSLASAETSSHSSPSKSNSPTRTASMISLSSSPKKGG